jgi:hypothetical protein
MTELEIMQRAREYVEKLAKGIDPITGREVPEGEVINNVRVSRCLFYVADMLRKVIESGGVRAEREAAPARVMKRSEKAPFALSLEDRERYPFEDGPVTVSVIAQRLNEFVDQDAVQKLKTASITGYLMKTGLLAEEVKPDGTKAKRPTEAGRSLGISTATRTGMYGEYTAVIYDRDAQQFILDNLDAIAAINAAPLHENQGKPWAPEGDAWLRQAYGAGMEVKEMADQLKRSRSSIRSRLEKLGLTDR